MASFYLIKKIFKLKYFPVLLCSFLAATGCSKEVKYFPVSESQSTIFSYLPAETQFITYMNLNELRSTEFWDKFFKPSIESNKESNWLSEFESETGFGLSRGVKEVFITSSWEENNLIAVVFDENTEKVKSFFNNNKNFKKEITGSFEVYRKPEDYTSYFTFINDSLMLIVNDLNYFQNLADEKHLQPEAGLNSNNDLITIIEKIENKAQYWIASDKSTYAVGLLGGLSDYKSNEDIRKMLLSMKGFSLSAEFSVGVELKSVLICKDSKSAYLLASVIKGSVSLDLLSKGNAAINRILNKMKVERNSGNVNISVILNSEDLKDLRDLSDKGDTFNNL
jgi:hypothetical protein